MQWISRAALLTILPLSIGCGPKKAPGPAKESRILQLELVGGDEQEGGVVTQYPNYVNMIVRVTNGRVTTTDADGNTVPDFSNPDYYVVGLRPVDSSGGNFSILENGEDVKVEAGLRAAALDDSLQLRVNLLLDVSGSVGEAGLLRARNASKRLVARPCTATEVGDPSCFSYTYDAWDAEKKAVVTRTEPWRSVLKDNQTVNIYAFSDQARRIELRSKDAEGERYPDKTRRILDTLDREVALGVDSTNLYGALLAGLEDLKRSRSLDDPARGLSDGIVVVFTDGSHTSGDVVHEGTTYTPKEAIARIHEIRGRRNDLQSLRVMSIGLSSPELKDTITTGDMAGGGVRDLQNAGYLQVSNPAELQRRFEQATDLIDRYARSLYRIYYRTPKTGSQDVQLELRVTCAKCERKPDGSIPDYARVLRSVKTRAFYHVPHGVYVDDPILDEDGLPDTATLGERAQRGPSTISIAPSAEAATATDSGQLILANNPAASVRDPARTRIVRLHTYVRANDSRSRPAYTLASSDSKVLKVHGTARLSVIESIALLECAGTGDATLTVTDTANGGLSREVDVTCADPRSASAGTK